MLFRSLDDGLIQTPFDEYGNYRKQQPVSAPAPPLPDPDTPDDPASAEPSTPAEPNHYAEANLYEVFRAASNLNQRYIYDSETMPSAADDKDASEHTLPPKPTSLEVSPEVESTPSKVDYEKYRPYFLHVPKHKVQKTFENTTQHATNIQSGIHVGMTLKSPYPAFNV